MLKPKKLISEGAKPIYQTPINNPPAIDPDNNGGVHNEGEECFLRCKKKNGKCLWCGEEGMCCIKGISGIRDGCDGHVGGVGRHECTAKGTFDNSGKQS